MSSGEQSTIRQRRKEGAQGLKKQKVNEKREGRMASRRVQFFLVEDRKRQRRDWGRSNVYAVQRISSGVDGGGSILSFMQGKSTLRKAKCYSRIVLAEPFTYI